MQQVMKQPRAGVPFKRARHYYFVSRNNGTQNQDVTYVAWSLEELLAGGRVCWSTPTPSRRTAPAH